MSSPPSSRYIYPEDFGYTEVSFLDLEGKSPSKPSDLGPGQESASGFDPDLERVASEFKTSSHGDKHDGELFDEIGLIRSPSDELENFPTQTGDRLRETVYQEIDLGPLSRRGQESIEVSTSLAAMTAAADPTKSMNTTAQGESKLSPLFTCDNFLVSSSSILRTHTNQLHDIQATMDNSNQQSKERRQTPGVSSLPKTTSVTTRHQSRLAQSQIGPLENQTFPLLDREAAAAPPSRRQRHTQQQQQRQGSSANPSGLRIPSDRRVQLAGQLPPIINQQRRSCTIPQRSNNFAIAQAYLSSRIPSQISPPYQTSSPSQVTSSNPYRQVRGSRSGSIIPPQAQSQGSSGQAGPISGPTLDHVGTDVFPNYPSLRTPLPAGITWEECCRTRPNHLWDETLLQFEEIAHWTMEQVWRACPTDGRHYKHEGREWNYLQQRLRRAKQKRKGLKKGPPNPNKGRKRKAPSDEELGSGASDNEGVVNVAKRISASGSVVNTNDGIYRGHASQPEAEVRVARRQRQNRPSIQSQSHGSSFVSSAAHHRPRQVVDSSRTIPAHSGRLFPSLNGFATTTLVPAMDPSLQRQSQFVTTPNMMAPPATTPASFATPRPPPNLRELEALVNREVRTHHNLLMQILSMNQAPATAANLNEQARNTWVSQLEEWRRFLEVQCGLPPGRAPQGHSHLATTLNMLQVFSIITGSPAEAFVEQDIPTRMTQTGVWCYQTLLHQLKAWSRMWYGQLRATLLSVNQHNSRQPRLGFGVGPASRPPLLAPSGTRPASATGVIASDATMRTASMPMMHQPVPRARVAVPPAPQDLDSLGAAQIQFMAGLEEDLEQFEVGDSQFGVADENDAGGDRNPRGSDLDDIEF